MVVSSAALLTMAFAIAPAAAATPTTDAPTTTTTVTPSTTTPSTTAPPTTTTPATPTTTTPTTTPPNLPPKPAAAPDPSGVPASCSAAGTTGLTAAVVATTNDNIEGDSIDASNCDIGIFIDNNVTGVIIDGVTITGAGSAAILAQDTSNLSVKESFITGNGFRATVPQAFGISLFGVSNSVVSQNTVIANGRGGIGVMDDGPFNPGTPNPGPTDPVPVTGDTVSQNHISGNFAGCGIVLAVFNNGNTLSAVDVTNNVVTGTHTFGPTGPDVGGMVVSANGPGTHISNVTFSGNTATDAYEAGIIVHAQAPNSNTDNVSVTFNTLTGNNWGLTNGPNTTVGVIVGAGALPAAIQPTNTNTSVTNNFISNQYYGIWAQGPDAPTVSGNSTTVTQGGNPYFRVPDPGSGYWMAATDGGIFSFGGAGFFGSMGGQHLNKPVVGMAQTQDQGGYWEVASDGGIFSFGDAAFYGSMGGQPLSSPVVGIAATPYVPGANGAPAVPGGQGYWEVAAGGDVFPFGDAQNYGSMAGQFLNKPIVAIAATPDGKGYWEVASDGGVFSFGDAGFFGSMGGQPLNKPIVGIATTPDGGGYWEVASDGGIFSFGDATFYGSMGGQHLSGPVVGMSATPDGGGYWEVGADGAIYPFADAGNFGSMAGHPLNKPVMGMASVGTTFSG
jgi:hypothetical protein